ncbi:MAG TPA: PilN domain-containing protein [Thermoleophilaceae bacterium]|nr:PilN domain-containing protein [Thermoleophilaceae bacterium]
MKPVNLLPGEHRRVVTSSRPGSAYAVLGVLAVVLGMTVMYVLAGNQVKDSETRAAAAKQEATTAEGKFAQLDAFTDFASIKETRVASVYSVAQSRFDWERLMREVSRVLPKGAWLRTTEATVTPASDDAAPATATSTAVASGPTAQFVGCARSQSDVARLMTRLREMHRVEDVSLNESLQEAPKGAPTLDNCGRLIKFDVTVEYTATRPASEAPRGATRVPASLGGGS